MRFVWDDRTIAELRRHRSDGRSPAEIAGLIGAPSRNSVIGKLHRMNLTTSRREQGNIGQKRGGRQAAARMSEVPKPKPKPPMVPAAPVVALADLPPVVARVAFAELEAEHCRMPVGEVGQPGFGFCGEPRVPGRSYCACCHPRTIRAA